MRALTGWILAALAAIALPSIARAAAAETTLAERYVPVVRLVDQKEPCGHGEAYRPTDVNLVLGSPEVALRGPWDRTNIIKVGPTAADLAPGLFDYHLDFPGKAVAPGCVYDDWSHRINSGHGPHAYARLVTDSTYPGQLALQYWLFYVFNDFNDKHEGDWEMIQLNFDAHSAAEALREKPAVVGFSQHEGAESADWGDSKLEIVDGTHPVVYPALGSHANYFTSALHLGRSAAQGVGCDDTSGPSFEFRPQVSVIPTEKAAYMRSYPWLGFDGHWGEEHEGFYDGPTGPNTKLQWTEPIVWSTGEWRDKSFTVPVGTSFGTSATGFFCAAVATGSSVLTSIVGDPSPLLIALALLLGLILWLTSRTTWQPSAPLRLERRRPWGAITNASRRMYIRHLRLFLAVGLLFLPLGALITGLQYVLFRLSGLNGLVDSAGSTNAVVAFLAFALGLVLTVFGLAILNAATAVAMVDIDAGRNSGALAAYKKILPKVGPIVGVGLIVAVVIALLGSTFIGVLLAIWLIVRWAFFAQVIVLEDVSPVGALHRSARLVRGDWWRVASMLLFVTSIALLLGPLIGTLLLFVTSASFDFVNLISSVVYAVVLPFAAIASTYLYFDLRVAKRQAETDEADEILPADEAPPTALAPR
jgi:Vacuolar protein sorting-associated protein 62